jgi:hypothetical protein
MIWCLILGLSVDSVCDVGGKHHLCPQPVMLQCQAQQSGRCGLDDGLLDAPFAVADGADS